MLTCRVRSKNGTWREARKRHFRLGARKWGPWFLSRPPISAKLKQRRQRAARQDKPRSWYEKRDFLKLRRQWYRKLKRAGFHDLELIDWSTGEAYECLDGISQADVVNSYTPEAEEYYRMAVQWGTVMEARRKKRQAKHLGLPPVLKARDIRIWKLHADGKSFRHIAHRLRIGKGAVAGLIRRERERMLSFDWNLWDPS